MIKPKEKRKKSIVAKVSDYFSTKNYYSTVRYEVMKKYPQFDEGIGTDELWARYLTEVNEEYAQRNGYIYKEI